MFLNIYFNVIQLSRGSSRLLSKRKFWSLAPRSLRVGRFSWPGFYLCSVTPIDSCKTTGSNFKENLAQTSNFCFELTFGVQNLRRFLDVKLVSSPVKPTVKQAWERRRNAFSKCQLSVRAEFVACLLPCFVMWFMLFIGSIYGESTLRI